MRYLYLRSIIVFLCSFCLLTGMPCHAIGSGASRAGDEEIADDAQERKMTHKERRKELVDMAIGAIAVGIINGISGGGTPPPADAGGRAASGPWGPNVGGGRSSSNYEISCSKCGYSDSFFPYADSSKKSIKCPECGETKKIR